MADLLKILQEKGEKFNFLTAEAAEKLKAALKDEGFNLIVDESKNPEYVPKARLDDELQKKDLIKQQLDQQNTTMESLKKSAGDKEAIEKLLEAEKKRAQDLETNLQDLSLNTAIKLKVSAGDYAAHDPNDILKMLDKSKLKLNGENVDGLEDQLKTIKETKAYLFTAGAKPAIGGGSNPAAGGGGSAQPQTLRDALAEAYKVK